MCHKTTCKACGKATWAGCGQHIESALKNVPRNERCACTDAEKAAASGGSLFSRMFGR